MKIRKYQPKDRGSVEKINFETGFLGRSMEKLGIDRKVYANLGTRYYVEKEPESTFVLENDKGKVIGYLFGCLNDSRHNPVPFFISSVFSAYFKSIFGSKNDRKYWGSQIRALFKALFRISGELKLRVPKNAGHLHINLLPEARGKGYGSKMLKEFFKYAKRRGVKVVHADSYETRINPNTNFWLKNGFKEYSKARTSMWEEQLPNETIYVVCRVKRL